MQSSEVHATVKIVVDDDDDETLLLLDALCTHAQNLSSQKCTDAAVQKRHKNPT